jgi:membrane protein YqaA with SNARE-associated domain
LARSTLMLENLAEYGYWGLLLASFLAATILPFSSEVVFSALIAAGLDMWTLIIYATIGNAAGGSTCYYLGRLGKVEWLERWFKIKPESWTVWVKTNCNMCRIFLIQNLFKCIYKTKNCRSIPSF